MKFIYRGEPYQCSSTVLPKGPLKCNEDDSTDCHKDDQSIDDQIIYMYIYMYHENEKFYVPLKNSILS